MIDIFPHADRTKVTFGAFGIGRGRDGGTDAVFLQPRKKFARAFFRFDPLFFQRFFYAGKEEPP